MNLFEVLAIAVALAMDALAVSVAIALSLGSPSPRQTLRLALNFGGFQFFMPVLGWLAGQGLVEYIQGFDHWVAFGLLTVIGSKMIYEATIIRREETEYEDDPTRGVSLLLLSLATSIDALAVGLSLSLIHVGILYPAVIIGIVTFAITVIGVKTGPLLGRLLGEKIEIAGGLVLIVIGVKILLSHILAA
ncbi:MAG: manganese efflux pump MntP family protein [Candidatus Aureabacteria bacterium]|nr:manganese efflux pump MntP family protein [Candidatus Auribacterota bacterium]